MTAWRIGVAYWISKTTRVQTHAHALAHPHTRARARARSHRNVQYVMFLTTTVVSRTRLNITSYTHCLSCYGVGLTNYLYKLNLRNVFYYRHAWNIVHVINRLVSVFSVGKPEGRRPLGRPRCRWKDNIKIVLREVAWGDRLDRSG